MKLVVTGNPTVRVGTAREAAWNCILANAGRQKNYVLEQLERTEKQWHRTHNRTVNKIWPAGLLKLYKDYIRWEL